MPDASTMSSPEIALTHAARLSALGELAASIAHEVSQPLAAIAADAGAGLNWLTRGAPDLLAVQRSLEAIARESRRAGTLLSRVRAWVEPGPRQRCACDVANIILDVMPLVQNQLQQAEIDLQPLLAADLPSVLADAVELQQVLLNLILNAMEAMTACTPERRRITVRSTVEHRLDTRWVVVSVEDQGVGIGAAHAPRLFDAFYTTKPGGLGIGLSICRAIIERHNGTLWAESNPEQGATFHFSLPAH